MSKPVSLKRQRQLNLAKHRPAHKIYFEFFFMITLCCIMGYSIYTDVIVNEEYSLNPIKMLVQFVMGMALADFISGWIHWGADTYGSIDTPYLGKTFIRSFREHHVDPIEITRHNFIQTNGDNCMLAVGFYIPYFIPFIHRQLDPIFVFAAIFFLAATNQIHSWAHEQGEIPAIIKWAQDNKIILSRRDHNRHHGTPYDQYYCITTGWLNPICYYTKFWKGVEFIIEKVTGVEARWNDKQLTDGIR